MNSTHQGDEMLDSGAAKRTDTQIPKSRSISDYGALVIATCGVGFIPLAPGTWGSAVGVGIYWLLSEATLRLLNDTWAANLTLIDPRELFIAIQLIAITLITLTGIWAATRAEQIFQKKDPGKVVIDEVAGQLIALLPLPLARVALWPWLILAAFLLFRAFDIIKPFPVRRLESLKSGLGIVADDLGAGAYAAVLVAVLVLLSRLM
jgi:phosphatidylglycerophosphatase A